MGEYKLNVEDSFFEQEERNGYVVSSEMKRIWAVEMDLLKKLLEVCDKYHLRIWADGGTLLGAIREHGYIPWDDDIDMAMLRDDFDKLVKIAPKEFSHPYFFQFGYSEKYYPLGHAKLRMDNTTAIEPYKSYYHIHQGVFIDIFPYDAVPDDQAKLNLLVAERERYFSTVHGCLTPLSLRHPGRSFRTILSRLRYRRLFSQFEDVFRRNSIENNRCVSCLSFIIDLQHFLRNKEWYESTLYFPFEDIMMPVPGGYHSILERQYGDYMIPKQSSGYHSFWKIDVEHSYKEFLHELKRYLDRV